MRNNKQYAASLPVLTLAVFSLFATVPAHAWIFGGNKDKAETNKTGTAKIEQIDTKIPGKTNAVQGATRTVSRAHMRFENPEDEKQLITLISARRRSQEDYVVISRLIEEKNLEIKTFNELMDKEFGVNKDRNYQFEAESNTIYELVLKEASAAQQKTQAVTNAEQLKNMYDSKVHRVLKDDVEKNRFVRLAAGKQLAGEQIKMLSLLQNEKEIESESLQEEMARRYAISQDREYRYDSDTKTLFELVTIPADYKEPAKPDSSVKRK